MSSTCSSPCRPWWWPTTSRTRWRGRDCRGGPGTGPTTTAGCPALPARSGCTAAPTRPGRSTCTCVRPTRPVGGSRCWCGTICGPARTHGTAMRRRDGSGQPRGSGLPRVWYGRCHGEPLARRRDRRRRAWAVDTGWQPGCRPSLVLRWVPGLGCCAGLLLGGWLEMIRDGDGSARKDEGALAAAGQRQARPPQGAHADASRGSDHGAEATGRCGGPAGPDGRRERPTPQR